VFNDEMSLYYSSEMGWLGAQSTELKFGGLKPGIEKRIKTDSVYQHPQLRSYFNEKLAAPV
jgi:hypothetical protein